MVDDRWMTGKTNDVGLTFNGFKGAVLVFTHRNTAKPNPLILVVFLVAFGL